MASDQQVLAFLRDALTGNLDQARFDAFVAEMGRDEDPVLREAMHDLSHFQVDCDIRAKDDEYDRLCRETLASYVDQISSSNVR